MSEELISKKDLLELMNISYGQLYRWKRKKLIPEEWFIKKSVVTGQETFFPKDRIIERINKIIELKEELSLDDLANKFTGNNKNENKEGLINKEYLIDREYLINKFSEGLINSFESIVSIKDSYKANNIFSFLLFKILIENGSLSINEIREIITLSNEDYSKLKGDNYNLIIKRKMGVLYYYVIIDNIELFSSKEGILILNINFKEILEEIKKLYLSIES